MRRRTIAVAAVVVVAFFAVTLLTLTHIVTSGDQGCSVPAPRPDLPAQLRALAQSPPSEEYYVDLDAGVEAH